MIKKIILTYIFLNLLSCMSYYGYSDSDGNFHDFIFFENYSELELYVEIEYMYQRDITDKMTFTSYAFISGSESNKVLNPKINFSHYYDNGTSLVSDNLQMIEEDFLHSTYIINNIKQIDSNLNITFEIEEQRIDISKLYKLNYNKSIAWFDVALGI